MPAVRSFDEFLENRDTNDILASNLNSGFLTGFDTAPTSTGNVSSATASKDPSKIDASSDITSLMGGKSTAGGPQPAEKTDVAAAGNVGAAGGYETAAAQGQQAQQAQFLMRLKARLDAGLITREQYDRALAQLTGGVNLDTPSLQGGQGTGAGATTGTGEQSNEDIANAIIRNTLFGADPEMEQIAASMDLRKRGLMAEFAGSGAGAREAQLLNLSAQVGGEMATRQREKVDKALEQIEQVRASGRADEYLDIAQRRLEEVEIPQAMSSIDLANRQQDFTESKWEDLKDQWTSTFDRLKSNDEWQKNIDLLSSGALSADKAKAVVQEMGAEIGLDFASIPEQTQNEMIRSYIADVKGYDLDNLTTEQENYLNTATDNLANAALGLTEEGEISITAETSQEELQNMTYQDFSTDSENLVAAIQAGNANAINYWKDNKMSLGSDGMLTNRALTAFQNLDTDTQKKLASGYGTLNPTINGNGAEAYFSKSSWPKSGTLFRGASGKLFQIVDVFGGDEPSTIKVVDITTGSTVSLNAGNVKAAGGLSSAL